MNTNEKTEVSGSPLSEDVLKEVERLVAAAHEVSADVGQQVEEILRQGHEHPMDHEELLRLLTRVAEVLRQSALQRQDAKALAVLEGEARNLINRLVDARKDESQGLKPPRTGRAFKEILLSEHNGIRKGPVFPTPTFHEKEVPMQSGFVRTTDIVLWDNNERLDIHLRQFLHKYGRKPNAE